MKENEEKIEQKLIGIIDNNTCSSKETQNQINEIIQYKISISDNNEVVKWSDLYDKNNTDERVLFNSIIADRKKRVDENIALADRPRFAVCTIINGVCERIEFYEGHDRLEKTFDLRSKKLMNQELQDYLENDEYAYNTIDFLKTNYLIDPKDEKLFSDILNILDSSNEKELREKAEKYIKDNK